MNTPPQDPLALFAAWFEDARTTGAIRYPHAMTVATVDADGLPDARTLLLQKVDGDAFAFFTDAESVKGRQLERRPEVALVFYWEPLDRQVRVRGRVEPGSDELADFCFAERPRRSQLTTWASRQSRPYEHRDELEERYEEASRRFSENGDEGAVPRPPSWRAYRVVPRTIEFWQARAGRLHDRLLYTRDGEGWTLSRLDP